MKSASELFIEEREQDLSRGVKIFRGNDADRIAYTQDKMPAKFKDVNEETDRMMEEEREGRAS